MKLLRHSLFRVLLLSATMFVGVATQASCQSKSKKQTTQEASHPHVMVIDAKYMKEHIYDFEKIPQSSFIKAISLLSLIFTPIGAVPAVSSLPS